MAFVNDRKLVKVVNVSIVVPAQEAVLLAFKPPLLHRKLFDEALFVDFDVHIVLCHVLLQLQGFNSKGFKDVLFRSQASLLLPIFVSVKLLVRVNMAFLTV